MSQGKLRRWLASPRAVLRTILQLDDTPHSIALGTAIGVFVGFTPTVGIQMVLVMLVAIATSPFFQFNRMAALIAVYISNPLTMLPIYWFSYEVGTLFVGGDVTRDEFAQILHYEGFAQWWDTIVALFIKVGWPLVLGSLVIASVAAVATYPLLYRLASEFDSHRVPLPAAEADPPSASGSSVKEEDRTHGKSQV